MNNHLVLENVAKTFGKTEIIRGVNLKVKKERYTLLLDLMEQEKQLYII